MKRILAVVITGGLMASLAHAEVAEQTFKIVGTWGTGSMYRDYEAPMWNEAVPEAAEGRIRTDIQAITDLGLTGSETVKLLSSGAFDAGFGLYAYIVSGNPVFEGFDLSFVPTSASQLKKMAEAHEPVIEKAMADIHDVKTLANYPFPLPVIACTEEFNGLADLKGRKIRVFSATLGDMVEGLGAVPLSIPLAEVPTALQRGVIDCGIASAIAMYNAKWFDVVNYVYEMPVGGALAFLGMTKSKWDGLDAATQKLLMEQARSFAGKTWAATESDEQQGIVCLTGETLGGPDCSHGGPAKMTLVRINEADAPIREAVLKNYVLKRFAERCGAECTKRWNETAGAVIGIEAPL